MSQKLVRASEIKELLDLSSNARVYALARRSILPGVVRVGRQLRFDMAKIQAFIESGGRPCPDNGENTTESKQLMSAERSEARAK